MNKYFKALVLLLLLFFLHISAFSYDIKEYFYEFEGFDLKARAIDTDVDGNIYICGRLDLNYDVYSKLENKNKEDILNSLVENYYRWIEFKNSDNFEKLDKSEIEKKKNKLKDNLSDKAYVIKINKAGEIKWFRIYDFSYTGIDINTSEGDHIMLIGFISGYREAINDYDRTQGVVAACIDQDGNVIWNKIIPSEKNSTPNKIIRTKDNNFIILADENMKNYKSYIRLIKINIKGEIIWDKKYSSLGNTFSSSIIENNKNELIICGTYSYSAASMKIFLFKIDKNGNVLWNKKITVPESSGLDNYSGRDILLFKNAYLVAGVDLSEGCVLLNVSENKNIFWKTKNINADAFEENRIILSKNIYIAYTGDNDNKNHLVKINKKGKIINDLMIPGDFKYNFIDAVLLDDNTILLTGYRFDAPYGDRDTYLIMVKNY